jgi:hypothetical protein
VILLPKNHHLFLKNLCEIKNSEPEITNIAIVKKIFISISILTPYHPCPYNFKQINDFLEPPCYFIELFTVHILL